jgi:hypothetical protein
MTVSSSRWIQTRAANQQLQEISKAAVRETVTAVRHKCFLSYHSIDAEEVLRFVESYGSVFIPKAIGISEDDPYIESDDVDYVMQRIRDKYLADSTVTIVMVGTCTWSRKYIDWEVYSTLRRDKNNRLSGLMAIELPSISAGHGTLPSRVALNVSGKNGDEGYARYWNYPASAKALQSLIQDAHNARITRDHLIRLGSTRKINNSACP